MEATGAIAQEMSPSSPRGARWCPARRRLSYAAAGVAAAAVAVAITGGAWSANGGASTDPARLRVTTALIDEVIRGVLPLDVVLPAAIGGGSDGGAPLSATAIVLTELRYCGVTEKGSGRFRGVMRSASLVGASAPVLGGEDGCRLNLGDLTRRLANGATGRDEFALADVEAVWRPWELRLAVTRISGPGPAKPGEPRPLAALENRREMLVLSTAGLHLVTDAGETINLHVGAAFLPDAIDLLALLGENGGGPATGRPGGAGQPPAVGGAVNVAADIPHSFANQLLRQLTSNRALSVPVERDVIDVQNVTVAGSAGGLVLVGAATPRSLGETARLTIQAGGEEARLLNIRAEAQLENCGGMGTVAAIGCATRNAARNAAAAGLGAALTQKYQGQAARDLAGTQTLRFDVGNRRFEFRGELMHLASSGRSLSVAGRFASGGPSH